MNVLLITNSNISSGAGVIAKDFRDAFQKHQVDAKIMVNQYSGELDYVYNIQSEAQSKKIARLRNFVKHKIFKKLATGAIRILANTFNISNGLVFRSLNQNKYFVQDINQTKNIHASEELHEKASNFKPDAIIVLFMQNFITYQNIHELSQKWGNIPVFVTVLDMAPITGGCHYTWDCLGYQNSCTDCPAVSKNYKKFPEKNLKFKQHYAQKGNFNFVYSSDYQKEVLSKAQISGQNKQYKIPLPTNEDYYFNNPEARMKFRNALGFSDADIVVFFGAMDLANPRKGGKYLKEMVKKISNDSDLPNLKFLIIGSNHTEFETIIPKDKLKTLDVISPRELPNYYNAADIFLSPSVEDAGPMMVNQSLMCGTRVCAFEIGVAIDMVKSNNDCGKCAEAISTEDLYKTLKEEIRFQSASNRSVLREKCAEKAFFMTSKSEVSKKWIDIINDARNNK
ncbi:glycosyltransferase [Kordia sp.]|uniref:glycosyltransferase n=1 Tax=Kordia sp. TaxID=1965332 RepID=UPI003D2DA6F6